MTMQRAWPFENRSEGVEKIRTPQEFLARSGTEGSEAIVIRIGMNDAQLILVDGIGRWDRWVFHSMKEALSAAQELDIPVHEGEYPEATRVRIGKHQPDAAHYAAAAYPEQGQVGPIKAYPENRPRRLSPDAEEAAPPR